jgi:hypothetical protein
MVTFSNLPTFQTYKTHNQSITFETHVNILFIIKVKILVLNNGDIAATPVPPKKIMLIIELRKVIK